MAGCLFPHYATNGVCVGHTATTYSAQPVFTTLCQPNAVGRIASEPFAPLVVTRDWDLLRDEATVYMNPKMRDGR